MRLSRSPVVAPIDDASLAADVSLSRSPPVASGPRADLAAVGIVTVGALLVIWAYRMAPTSRTEHYDPVFWAGMLLGYLAVAWRAMTGRYAVFWLGFLGLFTLLPKFLLSPGSPYYFDEISQFALLRNVISSGQLFQHTPLLPIGTFYPGLESAAADIHWMTGLSPWASAQTLVAVVHCLLLVQIYYIARALSVSPRWAAAAAVVYAANPSFVYGDSIFGYETLAELLMLTIVRLYVEALAAEGSGTRTWRQTLAAAVPITLISFGLVVTHHVYSLMCIALLLAGALFLKPMRGFADRNGGWRRLFVRWTPALTLAACLTLWVAVVAPTTVTYLWPYVANTASGLVDLARGARHSGVTRPIFGNSPNPGYEVAAAITAPVIVAVAFALAGARWLLKPPLRSNFLWPFAITAAYLVSLPLTLLGSGAEPAHFTWPSTFIGVALLPAALVMLFELDRIRPRLKRWAAAAGAALLAVALVGNTTAGISLDHRFPGPYQFGSDTLGVTPETLRFAHWVQAHVGPGAHVVTDRFTALALTAHADAVTPMQEAGGGAGLQFAIIWYLPGPPPPTLMSAMEREGDGYLAVDIRDAQHTLAFPPLFYTGEPKRVPLQNITQLTNWPWLRLIYSSQHYRLYKIDYHSYFFWYPFYAKEP